ncbi:MAG: hypothetical protein M0P71_01400 [Melioribacteraceae bacterium]|nr:hypothetical protein [Melioribacteraceae bacterium]
MSVIQHHGIDFNAGIMDKINNSEAWGGNALQTINITRNTPRNPHQAVGYRGVVDFSSGQITTELSLDCILTEQAVESTVNTGVYKHAEQEMIVGTESYVLNSCSVGFQAGNPATLKFGYLTAGLGSALVAAAQAPDVLVDGEESVFAVVMGSDGSGVNIVNAEGVSILPSGVQSINYSANINKNNIMDIRSSNPIQFVTTYPIDITVNLEVFDKSSVIAAAGNLTSIGVKLAGGSSHSNRTGYATDPGVAFANSSKLLVMASGLSKTQETESINVGGYLTYTFNYTASDLWIPLTPNAVNA